LLRRTAGVIFRITVTEGVLLVGNWINWLLVLGGILCVVVELAMGVLTGFDLALIGGSLTLGGVIGLIAASDKIGLLAAGVLCFVYFALFRRWLKAKLQVKQQLSNVDAVVGRSGTVTRKIGLHQAGTVKIGSEEWRAELAADGAAKDAGSMITVVAVEGVTLKVR
jgi:membrane protein implicated in regulation of membrane protease activity